MSSTPINCILHIFHFNLIFCQIRRRTFHPKRVLINLHIENNHFHCMLGMKHTHGLNIHYTNLKSQVFMFQQKSKHIFHLQYSPKINHNIENNSYFLSIRGIQQHHILLLYLLYFQGVKFPKFFENY